MMEPDIRCEWRNVTGHACAAQATASVRFAGPGSRLAALCDEHANRWSGALRDHNHPVRIEPLCRDPRPLALLCGALAGAIPPDVRDVIADYIAHDRLGQADPSPLLDLAEQRGLHEGGYGPERYEEWAERDAHGIGDNPHVWLPVHREADGRRWISPVWKRCPCGEYEGDDGKPWRRDRRLDESMLGEHEGI